VHNFVHYCARCAVLKPLCVSALSSIDFLHASQKNIKTKDLAARWTFASEPELDYCAAAAVTENFNPSARSTRITVPNSGLPSGPSAL
jgi:hypothetical protein